jgi:hypothetical protein
VLPMRVPLLAMRPVDAARALPGTQDCETRA